MSAVRASPVAVVTGATSGLGQAVAHDLAIAGFHIVVVSRDADRCAASVGALRGTGGSAEAIPADLTTWAGADHVVRSVAARHPAIALLVNNAGAIFADRRETEDGHERTFALNVRAPFVLTQGLLRHLRNNRGGARVVNVASAAHRGHSLHLGDLETRNGFGSYRAYGRSKLALILLTREMAGRVDPSEVAFFAVHPGLVRTRWGSEAGAAMRMAVRIGSIIATSPEKASRTVLFAATSPTLVGRSGLYIARERVVAPSHRARDPTTARELYNVLVRMDAQLGFGTPGARLAHSGPSGEPGARGP